MRVYALATLICLAIAGCSSGAENEATPEPSSESSAPTTVPTPDVPKTPVEEFRTSFTPRPDIVRARNTPVESWSEVNPNAIALNFTAGTPECYGVDPVVTETDTTVEVAVRTGVLPETADKMCVLISVMGTVEVPLQAPVGDRTVVGR
ncbi:hypothetical protein [Rhodococcus sp. NPDC058521]|uniref:hypothetical protein n=1 Tax=Rhodococcus sp. NPDC058521 TaxID=3346536 RepID=UPI0036535F48